MASPFFQDFPAPPDLYAGDRALHAELKHRLPPAVAARAAVQLEQLGKATAGPLPLLMDEALRQLPEHVPYDAFGRRVDALRVSRAWDELKAFSATHGVVATGYDATFGAHRRVVQAALLHVYSSTCAVFVCPLAMTDAAARVLLDIAPPAVRDRLVPRILSRDPGAFITSGQWMTEREGGSDVGRTATIARPLGGDRYTLHGTKWFTSATTSEMALALARIDDGNPVAGSKGLSLFVVDVERLPSGGLNGISINRLKDKLGTKAVPTAELTLDGVVATRIGEVGRGVASIAGMLNITRYYNAAAASSGMQKAHALARAYAWHRDAFGAPVASHPLHGATLDDLEADAAGALAFVLEAASLIGKSENGDATDEEKRRLRALVPILKLTTGKQAVAVASEALEAFGGAGYIEDTGLPTLLRDAQVLPIWEGTTNILSLDVLRAESRDRGFSALLANIGERLRALPASLPADGTAIVRTTFEQLTARVSASLAAGGPAVEREARRIALTTGYLVECVLLGETAARVGTEDAARRFAALCHHRLMGPLG